MSYILNDASTFAAESAAGFVAANRALVRRVTGGVARARATPPGQVAVVIGGGSGHYPAFAGLVGRGLAHGAAMGNVFASPSAQQIYAVAKAVATDAGVLLTYGNYAGDVLNFDQAERRLRDEGIACRSVPVTDDIYSAGDEEREKRRGIAGDLAVFRAAGWAAEQGWDLDRVAQFAVRANERTRTLGVAFSGCTLPGASEPLFTVPTGMMAVGMGIHGEPGIDQRPTPTARELAILFVDTLLDQRPSGISDVEGAHVGVILNGLGAVKSEELFVIYETVAERLDGAGVLVVDPEVGEYATSFEMAGVSLTVFWLDDELEAAWTSPAYTPAFRKGAVTAIDDLLPDTDVAAPAKADLRPSTAGSRAAAQTVLVVLRAMRAVIDQEADALGRLDAVAGDGDHGIGMQRGVRAAEAEAATAVTAGAGAGSVLQRAGDAWADQAGGTSGALWGSALRVVGTRIGDEDTPAAVDVADGIEKARAAIQDFGKASVGDKTLVDALVPFARTLNSAVADGRPLAVAWREAAQDATVAAAATADLLPRMGRARPHAEKSVGTPDPGAISLALAMTAAGTVLTEAAASKEKS